jgi:integrase
MIAWNQFMTEVLALYTPPIRRIATFRKMRQALEEFSAVCPTTADLGPTAIARWVILHQARRPESNLSLLRTLRAACTYGMLCHYLEANPFDWRSPTAWIDWDVEELPPPVHSAEEIDRVLTLADQELSVAAQLQVTSCQLPVASNTKSQTTPRDPLPSTGNLQLTAGNYSKQLATAAWRAARLRAVVYTFAFTGARRRELLGLAVEDVDLVASTITIRTNRRRGLKTRKSAARLPIAAQLGQVLAEWISLAGSEWLFPGVRRKAPWLEGPCGDKALDQVKALGLRAGVPGLTLQSFRHTFASLSEGWGIGELALQRILRHTRIRTQRAYRHELPAVLREAAAKIHFQRGER